MTKVANAVKTGRNNPLQKKKKIGGEVEIRGKFKIWNCFNLYRVQILVSLQS